MDGEFTVTTTSQTLYDLIDAAGALNTTNIPNLYGSGTVVVLNRGAGSISWNSFGDAVAGKGIDIATGAERAFNNDGVTSKVVDMLKNIRVIATASETVGIAIF